MCLHAAISLHSEVRVRKYWQSVNMTFCVFCLHVLMSTYMSDCLHEYPAFCLHNYRAIYMNVCLSTRRYVWFTVWLHDGMSAYITSFLSNCPFTWPWGNAFVLIRITMALFIKTKDEMLGSMKTILAINSHVIARYSPVLHKLTRVQSPVTNGSSACSISPLTQLVCGYTYKWIHFQVKIVCLLIFVCYVVIHLPFLVNMETT